MEPLFDHEKLRVYKSAIAFVAWTEPVLNRVPRSVAAYDQLDRAGTSIPLNIAKGNGKFTSADRCRFFDTARGSALECAAGLDVLVAKERITRDQVLAGKQLLADTVSMLVGLIKSNSPDRVFEDAPFYAGTRSITITITITITKHRGTSFMMPEVSLLTGRTVARSTWFKRTGLRRNLSD